MADRVAPEGSPYAPLYLIGEAPGPREMDFGRPFVGPSYTDKLLPWWRACVPAISRDMVFIDNVLDYKPDRIDGVSELEFRAAFAALRARISAHPGPDGGGPIIIVPTGNYALYALTGHGRVSFHQRDGRNLRPGIESWRGSILEFTDDRGRSIKLIPTVHPAATFPYRTPQLEWVCRMDWQRIASDLAFRELRLPKQTHIIMPGKGEAIEWIRWARGEAARRKDKPADATPDGRVAMSLDVETPYKTEYELRQKASTAANPKCATCGHTKRWHETVEAKQIGMTEFIIPSCCSKKGLKKDGARPCTCSGFATPMGAARRVKVSEDAYLGCVGYSFDPSMAICIPTTEQYWHDPDVLAGVLSELAAFHDDPNVDFFGQNFAFDAWWCWRSRMPIRIPRWDLMKMHRVQRPFSEWHDLAFQASIDTRQPYWKDEAKDPQSLAKFASNSQALFDYNCIDNCTQRTLLPLRLNALREGGRLEYYEQMEAPMDPALVELSFVGIRADVAGRAAEFDRVMGEAKLVSAALNAVAKTPIVRVNKKGEIIGKVPSDKKLKAFLYETLHLPPQYTKNTKKQRVVSANVVALRRLMDRFPGHEQLHGVGKHSLHLRRLNTIANFVKEEGVSADGRVYGMFKQDTLLGRLKCEAWPNDEGRNLQNIDRRLRKLYLPDRETDG